MRLLHRSPLVSTAALLRRGVVGDLTSALNFGGARCDRPSVAFDARGDHAVPATGSAGAADSGAGDGAAP